MLGSACGAAAVTGAAGTAARARPVRRPRAVRRAYVASRRAAGERDMEGHFVVRSGRFGRHPTVARIAGHGICLATRPGTAALPLEAEAGPSLGRGWAVAGP